MQPHIVPDLEKSDPLYVAHAESIREVAADAYSNRAELQRIFDAAPIRNGEGRPNAQLSIIRAIDKESRIYCGLLQRAFHTIAMDVYGNDGNPAHIREIVDGVLSVRLSMLNFPIEGKPKDYRQAIADTDTTSREATGESIVPYLFSPNSAISRVKTLLQDNKFAAVDLLGQLTQLYRDEHILHSMCICLSTNGMSGEAALLIENEAAQQEKETWLLLAASLDLTGAYLLALVESGKPQEAVAIGKKLLPNIVRNEKSAEKYAAALRMLGQFDEAIVFLRKAQEAGLVSKQLAIQFSMARNRDSAMLPGKLGQK